MEHYNGFAPFPVYDTEIVSDLREYIQIMERDRKEFDDLPVIACTHCTDLYIIVDELDNNICGRCGAVNEITLHKNIDEYLEYKNKINEDY